MLLPVRSLSGALFEVALVERAHRHQLDQVGQAAVVVAVKVGDDEVVDLLETRPRSPPC